MKKTLLTLIICLSLISCDKRDDQNYIPKTNPVVQNTPKPPVEPKEICFDCLFSYYSDGTKIQTENIEWCGESQPACREWAQKRCNQIYFNSNYTIIVDEYCLEKK